MNKAIHLFFIGYCDNVDYLNKKRSFLLDERAGAHLFYAHERSDEICQQALGNESLYLRPN